MIKKIASAFLILFLVLALILVAVSKIGSEDRTYEKQRLELGSRIARIMYENKVCAKQDCNGQTVFNASPSSRKGVSILLWGIESNKAVQQVLNECNDIFMKTDGMNIVVSVYGIKHEEQLNRNLILRAKPVMVIELNRKGGM